MNKWARLSSWIWEHNWIWSMGSQHNIVRCFWGFGNVSNISIYLHAKKSLNDMPSKFIGISLSTFESRVLGGTVKVEKNECRQIYIVWMRICQLPVCHAAVWWIYALMSSQIWAILQWEFVLRLANRRNWSIHNFCWRSHKSSIFCHHFSRNLSISRCVSEYSTASTPFLSAASSGRFSSF